MFTMVGRVLHQRAHFKFAPCAVRNQQFYELRWRVEHSLLSLHQCESNLRHTCSGACIKRADTDS